MIKLKQYQVDAFAARTFEGNPAAVIPLEAWLSDATMLAIASENNYSETAYFIAKGDYFDLRWFTPEKEVDLCGHATLATAHVIFRYLGYKKTTVVFHTRSGELRVDRAGNEYCMDFPAQQPVESEIPFALIDGLGYGPVEVYRAMDYIAVFDDESVIRKIQPNNHLLSQLDLRGVSVTSPSKKYDFVSRMFAPKIGITEDHVTGSVHCALAPFWAERLGKNNLRARQLSKRGGELRCEVHGDRVLLFGPAITFLIGEIEVPTD